MASLDELKQEILSRVDLVEVVEQYVQLTRNGRDFKGLSPFTKERTPSFVVHPDEQFFKCFSSGEGGDVITFVMKVEGLDFMGAMKTLAKRAGIDIEDRLDKRKSNGPNRDRLHGILSGCADLYRKLLLESPTAEAARAYIKDRDLDGEIGETFLIGYAPDSFDTIVNWAADKGYTDRELDASGILSSKEKADGKVHRYDRFRDRIMFPIRNEIGRVIGFSGRVLKKESSPAKYVNSPDGPLFHKSQVLFGFDLARKPMVEKRQAVICEGQIDVIRCHQYGFDTAVASQGTAVTDDHARMIKRYADEVVLMMDSDKAGLNAALKSGGIFIEHDLSVRVIRLPDGDDPDTILCKSGAAPLEELLKNASSFVDFQIDILREREDAPDSEAGQIRIAQAVLEAAGRAPSAIRRDQFLQAASQRLGLSMDALKSDLDRKVIPRIAQERVQREARRENRERTTIPVIVPKPETADNSEEALLCLLKLHPELRPKAVQYLPGNCFSHPDMPRIMEAFEQNPEMDAEQLVHLLETQFNLPDPMMQRLRDAVPQNESELGTPEVALQDIIKGLHTQRLKRERAILTKTLETASPLESEVIWNYINQITVALPRISAKQKDWEVASDLLEIHIKENTQKVSD